ncbi:transglycosylase SLT domain-containing protein [Gilvimarinus sp. F26214L]|uniref:transglycosylase SLT domain-containing protein n=1 Tax=Gilvimarinus sp. DZF01 TaxID=3461371 RepID=UPI0040462CA6
MHSLSRFVPKFSPQAVLNRLFVPLVLGTLASAGHGAQNSDSPSLVAQRADFLAAEDALRTKQLERYRSLHGQLGDYPLQPYLEYSELRRRLYLLPHEDVDHFLERHSGTYIGERLAREWLETLAKNARWRDYQKYFPLANTNRTELRCYHLRARLKTGDEKALEEVAELWNVGRSQPKTCDPLFRTWMERGYLSGGIAWERHGKAIAAGNLSLARYIARKMPAELRPLADLYTQVHRQPEQLANHDKFAAQTPEIHEIILHGIRRYALRDPLAALGHWERYDAQHYFPAEDRARTQEYLITHLAVEGHVKAAQRLLKQTEEVSSSALIAWLVRDALRSLDWQRAWDAMQLFPEEEQQSPQWLYWRARALENLEIEDPRYSSAEQIYASVALSRSFYGFLAADLLGREYTLVDRPVSVSTETIDKLRGLPGIRRAKELLDLDRINQARGEWYYATRNLEPMEKLAAGKLAAQWGWYRKSIQAMIEARYWDDLQLRFPLAYEKEVASASASTNIEPHLLYAIARQESAFAADARSPAGAMGLMQLLPSTAKRTAREQGMRYDYWDLIDPNQNIQLGSRYLHGLLTRFNGNPILAAAAYNAGPYRVQQWLENGDRQLPYDIWIETIPYKETRNYVQNVLAYSVIYGYRMGKPTTMFNQSGSEGITMLTIGGLGSGTSGGGQ